MVCVRDSGGGVEQTQQHTYVVDFHESARTPRRAPCVRRTLPKSVAEWKAVRAWDINPERKEAKKGLKAMKTNRWYTPVCSTIVTLARAVQCSPGWYSAVWCLGSWIVSISFRTKKRAKEGTNVSTLWNGVLQGGCSWPINSFSPRSIDAVHGVCLVYRRHYNERILVSTDM